MNIGGSYSINWEGVTFDLGVVLNTDADTLAFLFDDVEGEVYCFDVLVLDGSRAFESAEFLDVDEEVLCADGFDFVHDFFDFGVSE